MVDGGGLVSRVHSEVVDKTIRKGRLQIVPIGQATIKVRNEPQSGLEWRRPPADRRRTSARTRPTGALFEVIERRSMLLTYEWGKAFPAKP